MEKYEVKKVVGEGSFGKAVLCKRKADARLCIIKQISIKKLSRKEALLTEQEATLLKRLQHPNIVSFWESFVTSNSLYIVMEYADGGDLERYIKSHAKAVPRREIPEKQVLHLFVQISLAIKHIHDRKILHRDLKSQNIFLTSSGQLKLGDFGVSRVLRHTVELAATQIGTPYYMSPEIMDNQRYNSKTDIWSLGCILYEMLCLRLPFDGSSMKQLCYNIIKMAPAAPPSTYSAELRELVRDLLHKNPKQRPGINAVLARPLMRSKITALLGETTRRAEFSHTVLHGANVLQGPVAAPAPAVAPPPPPPPPPPPGAAAAGAAPAQRPVSVPSVPGPGAASAAQAVAILQQQRQMQLLRQQQAQAQQQQYVNKVAAQMKEQVELARRAEAERVRAQQLQAEEALRRQRGQLQAQAQAQERAKAEQAKLGEQLRAAERARAAAAAEAARMKQQQQEQDRLRRAALAEQQQKLEKRRQERLEYEAQRARQEKERDRAQRARLLAYQQQQPPAAKAGSPSLCAVPAASRGKGMVPGAAPVAVGAVKRPGAVLPSAKAEPAAGPAPVRQFSAAALLAKRRHSAPEKSPVPVSARPPWVSVLDAPPAEPSPGPAVASPTGPDGYGRAHNAAQPTAVAARPPDAAVNPFRQIVGEAPVPRAGPAVDEASEVEEQRQKPPRSPEEAVSVPVPVPRRIGVPASPSSQGSARSQAVDSVISKAQGVLQAMQDLQGQHRERVKRPPLASPGADSAANDGGSGSGNGRKGGLMKPTTPAFAGNSAQGDDCSEEESEDEDAADTSAAPIRAPPLAPIDTSPVPDSGKGSAAGSPWLSDLLGQMGHLKNQMQNLQHLRSPAGPAARRVQVAVNSPSHIHAPMHSREGEGEGGEGDGSDGQQSSPSVVSSITATSPGSAPSPFSGPSSANTPRDGYAGHPFRAVSNTNPSFNPSGDASAQQEPRRVLQQRAKVANVERTARSSGGESSSRPQRMSYPLADAGSGPSRQQNGSRQSDLQSNSCAESDDASVSTALSQRKEARDKHQAEFRAFVQARRQHHEDHTGGGETPPLRLDVPAAAPAEVRARGTPPVGRNHKSPHSAGMKNKPSSSKPSADAAKPWHPAKASALSGRRGGLSSNVSPIPTPPSLPAQSPHSIVSSNSSCPSLLSPRAEGSVGFNVAEFRSQREAERGEMRQLMKERRQQLRRAAQQHAEVVVLAQDPAPPRSSAATPMAEVTVPSGLDWNEQAPAAAPVEPAPAFNGGPEPANAQGSQLFAHLQDSALTEVALRAVEEPFEGNGNAAGGATLLEYSVLIEQMQAILRGPVPARKPAAFPSYPAGPTAETTQFTAPGEDAAGVAAGEATALARSGRALVGDLLLESVEEADLGEGEDGDALHDRTEGSSGGLTGKSAGAGPAPTNERDVGYGDPAVDGDDDEFGEEDDPLAQEAARLLLEGGDEERPEGAGDAVDDQGSEFGGSGGGSSQAGSLGDGEDAELLTFPEAGPVDPFMQPLVPALLTADALLLMDPLRHAFPPPLRPVSVPSAPAPATPPRGAAGHPGLTPTSDQSEKERRLRVAELQEYLVSKLGSAKVSDALHLLTLNTSATLTPGVDTAELGEDYYEERDEELLNRLEEILGTDSLHYLDDMFLLLTLQ